MKYYLLFFILLLTFANISFSQTTGILTKTETENLIENIKNIPFPIYRAYAYNDKQNFFNLILCEYKIEIKETDTINSKISAICYLQDHGGYIEKWRIIDAIEKSKEDKSESEISISFWTKYCTITDIDGDGIIEPVIVYGTKNENGFRRIKIITVFKGNKYAIRAVECKFDYCRTFKKDDRFNDLPEKIKRYIDTLLERMRKEQDVILSNH